MDLYCVKCSEPWDNDCIHDEADARGSDYRTVLRDFQSRGCIALSEAYGPLTCEPDNSMRSAAMSAMFDLLGDDADGAAAMMDDFEYMGFLD